MRIDPENCSLCDAYDGFRQVVVSHHPVGRNALFTVANTRLFHPLKLLWLFVTGVPFM